MRGLLPIGMRNPFTSPRKNNKNPVKHSTVVAVMCRSIYRLRVCKYRLPVCSSTVLPTRMVRQSERREATIAAILAAARKLFAAEGFDAVSIDGVAAKAGVAK